MSTVTKHAEKRTTRVRGPAPWQPQAATRALLLTVRAVLEEYAAYLSMTLRQVFYRLVGAHSYPKLEQAYARLGEDLNRARRAGLIDFNGIRADDADISTTIGYGNQQELINAWHADARGFQFDRQQSQPQRHLIALEALGADAP